MSLYTKRITRDFIDLDMVNLLAKEAFPPEEYLAPSKLIEMSETEGFDFLALYDGNLFIGFFVVYLYADIAYLFFLAIDSSHRSKGYGGQTLQLLEELYPNYHQVVDMEMLDDAAPNNEQRKTRKGFYIRNGYKETHQFLSYLGVDYEILAKDDCFNLDVFKRMMSTLRIDGFNPTYFTK